MQIINLELQNEDGSSQTRELHLALELSEMTFRQWVNYHILIENWPRHIKALAGKSQEEQREMKASWSNLQWANFYMELAKIVNNFLRKGTIQDVLKVNLFADQEAADKSGVDYYAHKIMENIYNYTPDKDRRDFTHNGVRYEIEPDSVIEVGEFKQTKLLPTIETGRVIEALQRAHVFGAVDEMGNYILPDKRYYTDIAYVACCSHVVSENGAREVIPWGLSVFPDWVNKRVNDLADLPADIALDVGFFLTDSLRTSLLTAMSPLLSSRRSQASRQTRRAKKRRFSKLLRKGTKRGGGTRPSSSSSKLRERLLRKSSK